VGPAERENERLRADNQALRTTILSLEVTISSLTSALKAQQVAFEDQKKSFDKAIEELSSLQRRFLGPKPEKMPRPSDEIRRRRGTGADPDKTKAKRAENARRKKNVRTERVDHRVADEKKTCPSCGGAKMSSVGKGRISQQWEYVPGYFVCYEHVQETLACVCGDYIVTADPPARPFDNAKYGPRFIAHLIVAKCVDSIPLHRLEKRFDRLGINMSRSTMTDLFHRIAEEVAPLVEALFAAIITAEVVQADETSIKIQDREKRGFVWTFLTEHAVLYRFSANRSGDTPRELLGGTEGVLVVDGYSAYNRVTGVDGRTRAGCIAHCRRKFFEAKDMAPEALEALELILDVYEVEHDAAERGITGTKTHLELRRARAGPVMDKFHAWLTAQKSLHPPRSKMGRAISYALKNWEPLTIFLDDARVPVDNNKAEGALRVAALGRKNFLFVGHEQAGKNLAGLYSLVATCRVHGVNPEEYLADVMMRLASTPTSQIAELLPDCWTSLSSESARA